MASVSVKRKSNDIAVDQTAAQATDDEPNKSIKLEKPENEKDRLFYEKAQRLMLTDLQLHLNNFPRSSDQDEFCELRGQSHQINNKSSKTCYRCKRNFVMTNGQFERLNDCCPNAGRNSNAGKNHVHRDNFADCSGYIRLTEKNDSLPVVYAVDCEMGYTVNGLELTRVSVVDRDCSLVYDSFVQPNGRIVDYNTKWSGIEEWHLRGVTTTLKDVQAEFKKRFSSKTIFLGHSLDSDFKALRIIHDNVIDTSVLYPHRRGPPYKRALRNLASDHLGIVIQDGGARGHDSHEDASACVKLLKRKLNMK
ncbi:putative exonuclease GOR [Clavelina lepadiformis]|uniref:putative exonuclease GOR n=1 Tax=Clavelina lepadiformis TaxID=159417 RepID=UPI004042E5C0